MSKITNNVYELMSVEEFTKLNSSEKARAIIENCFKHADLDDPWCGITLSCRGKHDYLYRNFRVSIDWEHLGWIYEEADKDKTDIDRGIHIYDSVVEAFIEMLHDQIIEEVKV